jgi:hypothetical protein
MKVLVLTFYYPPDLSAGAFRMKSFVPALAARLPAGSHIDVLTTYPNRYHTFDVGLPPAEEQNGAVRVRRLRIPPHRNGMLDQARSFSAFARGVLRATRGEHYDLVFATSSRLMTGLLASVVARMKRAPLYFDVRDIFADTMKEVLPKKIARPAAPLLSALERFTIGGARHVNLVSQGFADYFSERYPNRKFSYNTNGIDDEFLGVDWTHANGTAGKRRVILYAGNIGDGQGLHHVIPQLADALRAEAEFRIIGEGGKRALLEEAVRARRLDNVEISSPVQRAELIDQYKNADVLFLHLNDFTAFRRVLPSKLFEYAATGKPIWAGVAGHAADFLKTNVPNAVVFPPCDVTAALAAWRGIDFSAQTFSPFVRKFSRSVTSAALAADVVATVDG